MSKRTRALETLIYVHHVSREMAVTLGNRAEWVEMVWAARLNESSRQIKMIRAGRGYWPASCTNSCASLLI